MKKVRYVIGVIGVTPALGLAIPAVNAQAYVAHPKPGKTVSLALRHAAAPLVTCKSSHSKIALSMHANLSTNITWSGTQCVHEQGAFLYKHQTGLTERIRFYSGGGRMEHSYFIGGHVGFTSTSWRSSPNVYAHEVCQALVANSNHNDVKYGPLCETD
jgi:hypothetical protein